MTAPAPRTLIIVPAWNEEESLPGVLREIRENVPDATVLVVSDGSIDRTAAVARALGAQVLELPFNLGVGGAMRAGFRYARARGFDYAVQLDADGQHDPRYVPQLIAELEATGADLMIGARFAGVGDYEVRGPRQWSMAILSKTLSRVNRTKLTDTTSGFKAAGRRAINVFSANYPSEYLGDTIEALVIAARSGLTVRQLPVAMRPRSGGRPSHSPVKAAVFLGRAVFALSLALLRPTEPVPTSDRGVAGLVGAESDAAPEAETEGRSA